MVEMSQQEISDFIAESHIALLATVRPDGRPHTTPVGYMEVNGKPIVIAPANSVKFRNVGHNPMVSLSIATDQRPYRYVVLEGEGRLTDDNLVQTFQALCLRNEPQKGPDYFRQLLSSNKWLVLELEVHRVLSYKSD